MPRSCAAAVLYYQPVAEQVVELARRPSALPQVPCPCPICPNLTAPQYQPAAKQVVELATPPRALP